MSGNLFPLKVKAPKHPGNAQAELREGMTGGDARVDF
jgi:hypothetical protein